MKLKADFPEHGAAAFSPEEANEWAQGLITAERTAVTVRDVWTVAVRTVFGWAVGRKLLTRNPFAGVKIKVPKKRRLRDKAFTREEVSIILNAASRITDTKSKGNAARRWVPWLCAYTGARAGEIAQLRGTDVIERDDIHALNITPEAGSVKTGQARLVPLHQHLIEQGFLKFVAASGKGPLFYKEPIAAPAGTDATNPPKARYVKAREHVGTWVRGLGITDPEVKPNHAWRETFKLIGYRNDITERVLDAIVGHAPVSVGRGYGLPTLRDKAHAFLKFPRYELKEPRAFSA